jgi:hypothetical protein
MSICFDRDAGRLHDEAAGQAWASTGVESNIIGPDQIDKLPAGVVDIGFSKDGRWMTATDVSGSSEVWDRGQKTNFIGARKASYRSFSVSEAGRHIAAIAADESAHFWTFARYSEFSAPQLASHGSYLIACQADGATIVDARSGRSQFFPNDTFQPLMVSLDGKMIAGVENGKLKLAAFNDGQVGRPIPWEAPPEEYYYPTSWSFSPDNHYWVGSMSRSAQLLLGVWDLQKSGPPKQVIPTSKERCSHFRGG